MRCFIIFLLLIVCITLSAQQQELSGKLASRYNDIVDLKKTKQFEEAFHLLKRTLKKHPKHPDFLNLKAMVILDTGVINNTKLDSIAISFLNQAIGSDSTLAALYNNRGWLYQLLGQYKEAKIDFDKALKLDDNNIRYWHNPIRILFIQKNVVEVLALCNQAILKYPKDGYAYYVRGSVLREYVKKEKLGNDDLRKAHDLGWKKGFYFVY